MKRLVLFVTAFACVFALGASMANADPSNKNTVTYTLSCGSAGTVYATVQGTSASDAFHVVQVVGGNGTVAPGAMLLNVSYVLSNGGTFDIPGFSVNAVPKIFCTFASVRLPGVTGSGEYFVAPPV